MRLGKCARSQGFTLVELTMAMSVFMLVMGFTAQVLVSYFATLDTTNARTEAMRNAVGVLNEMRALRDSQPDAFPKAILEAWPQKTEVKAGPESAGAQRTTLPDERLTVTYVDEVGRLLSDSELQDCRALRVKVTSRWRTLHGGRWAETSIETVLSRS